MLKKLGGPGDEARTKLDKNDKLCFDMTQIVSILTVAIIFTGLSIQIARFHSQSGRGAYTWGGGAYSRDTTVHTYTSPGIHVHKSLCY